jgi:hypothetical protein
MTDKQIKEVFKNGFYCIEPCPEIKTLQAELKAREQECEGLKEEIKKHNDDMFKNPPEKRFYCNGCTLPYISKKLKQTLLEIKEIAEWHTTKADSEDVQEDMKQILQKISECEVE